VKPINSCLGTITEETGESTDGETGRKRRFISWSQKGHEAMVNNSIMATFSFHRQMHEQCPVNVALKVDVFRKLVVSCREILCKLSGIDFYNHETMSRRPDDVKAQIVEFLYHVFQIEEVRSLDRKELRHFCQNLLPSLMLTKKLFNEIPEHVLKELPRLNCLVSLPCNKESAKVPLFQLVDAVKCPETTKMELETKILQMVQQNYEDQKILAQCADLLRGTQYDDTRRLLLDRLEQGSISFDRVLSHCRRNVGSCVGVRVSILSMIDFAKIDLFPDKYDKKDLLKDIVFKICQSIAFAEGKEIYHKGGLIERFPEISSFLLRQRPALNDYKALTLLLRKMLAILVQHKDYRREIDELKEFKKR
jgi:hypothetical protein